MRPRPRPLARWTTRRLDPRPPASVSRVTGVNREACRSSFGCVARHGSRAPANARYRRPAPVTSADAPPDAHPRTSPARCRRAPRGRRRLEPRVRDVAPRAGFFSLAMRQGFSTADAPAVRLGARREPRAQPRRARRRRTCGRARAPPATATARWSGRRRTDARQTANPNARGREAHSVVDRDAFAFLRPPARTRR